MGILLNIVSFVIMIAFYGWLFWFIRKVHRKHKAKKLAIREKQQAKEEERQKLAKEHQADVAERQRREKIREEHERENKKKEFIEEHPNVDFDEKFKNGITKGDFYSKTDVTPNNIVDHLEKISKNKDGQVFFPESIYPYNLYYLTDIQFNQKYDTEEHIIKGQKAIAGKRGHHVRNTILFGALGALATHDQPGVAGTPDQVYQTKQPVVTEGYLKLVSDNFKHEYTVPFFAYQDKVDELRGMFVTSPDRLRYLEEHQN